MEDKNSSLFIDPFKYPSDDDIKKSWKSWEGQDGKPCKVAAIKWLQCMGITKEFYRIQGKDVNDGSEWHTYMLKKCFAPYTDYHECRIDQRDAKLEKMRKTFGEEKWEQSQEQVKGLLKKKLGEQKGEQVWEYRHSSSQRFKELRKAVDEDMGIIRDGTTVPDFDKTRVVDPVAEPVAVKTPEENSQSEEKPQSTLKGWWSEPESRFKKSGS